MIFGAKALKHCYVGTMMKVLLLVAIDSPTPLPCFRSLVREERTCSTSMDVCGEDDPNLGITSFLLPLQH